MIYSYTDPSSILRILRSNVPEFRASNSKKYYLNTPISFDIETSSFYSERSEKMATMYVWALDIYDTTIIGRTWSEFIEVINQISEFYKTNDEKRVIIYIHNLAYEMQFIRLHFKWKNVFSIRERKPIYALTTTGIEFRCSYLLTGYSLEKVGENLKNPIPKLIGSLDYNLIRHSLTPLTDEEIRYLIHDVKIVSEHIRQCIKDEGNNIANIPLTKTGYVRRDCRRRCIYGKKGLGYKFAIKELTIEPNEYIVARRAFGGGFTHANFEYVEEVMSNVKSFDFSSSYPAVMVSELFPMSKGILIPEMTELEFEHYIKNYLCIFNIRLRNVKSKCVADDYISRSKCCKLAENAIINNGRVHSAEYLTITTTNVDFSVIKKVYDFTIDGVSEFYYYLPRPLPSVFVDFIIEMYEKKTILKGVEGKEEEYLSSKENVNSLYGMCVTDIVRALCEYDCVNNKWDNHKETKEEFSERLEKQLHRENNSSNRFLFYLWGVFVTAYARRNLWRGILECGEDYIYSDTDSIKIINADKHMDFINSYNEEITKKIRAALIYHKIDPERANPKTIKGKIKPLGVWELDGEYIKFKTLGAKRYLYTSYNDDGEIEYHLTCAGLSKVKACEYIASQENPFDFFQDTMKIPSSHTGKLTHTYIDKEIATIVTDYLGITYLIHELSFIHLEPAKYDLSLSEEFKEFLKGNRRLNFN